MPDWKRVSANYAVEHIEPERDVCFFLMDYNPEATYENAAKSRVSNFQAGSNPKRRQYRNESCRQFAADLRAPVGRLLESSGNENLVGLSFIPTSKKTGSTDYDDRFETVCRNLQADLGNKLSLERPVVNEQARESVKTKRERRGRPYVDSIKRNFRWRGFGKQPGLLIVIDDVITSGGQFKAFREYVTENTSQPPRIVGLFWARTTSP